MDKANEVEIFGHELFLPLVWIESSPLTVLKVADEEQKAKQRRLAPKTRVWNGMENGMEGKFRCGIWKMPE